MPAIPNDTLAQSELAAVQAFLTLQNQIGVGITDNAAFMANLDAVSSVYGQVQNAQVTAWVDQLYDLVANTGTNYSDADENPYPVSAMYLVYQLIQYTAPDGVLYEQPWVNAFLAGYQPLDGGARWSPYFGPAAPLIWNQDVIAQSKLWDTNSVILTLSTLGSEVISFETGILSGWNNQSALQSGVGPLWESQQSVINSLISSPDSLSGDEYFYFLHLLLALGTGPSDCATLAQQIVNTSAASPEYPDTPGSLFANQLIYFVLMNLADPNGEYQWDNNQLQQAVTNLSNVVIGTDPASTAISQSLAASLKILQYVESYPILDPYPNPQTGFPTRQSDTQAALDGARASFGTSSITAATASPSPYAVTPADLQTLVNLVALQGTLTNPEQTGATLQSTITSVLALADTLTSQPPANSILGTELATLFTGLASGQTSLGSMAEILVAQLWAVFNAKAPAGFPAEWQYFAVAMTQRFPWWSPPPMPPVLSQALSAVVTTGPQTTDSNTPPSSGLLWDISDAARKTDFANGDEYFGNEIVAAWENQQLSPATFTSQLPTAAAPLWMAQASDVSSIMAATLDNDSAPYLFCCLAALCNSPTASAAATASQIVLTATSSPEYPSDTVGDQLLYLVLMLLADPFGNYSLTNPQLQTLLSQLTFPGSGSGGTALQSAIAAQLKLLVAVPDYPVIDPNVPYGFNNRKADTLACLLTALAGQESLQ